MNFHKVQYRTGDILEVNSYSIIPGITFTKHYGIYFLKDGIPYVTHNSFSTGNIEIQPFDEFMKGRKVYRVLNRANLTDEQIYNRSLQLQERKKYNFFSYNCEDYVGEICGCNMGFDQRLGWLMGLVGAIILIVLGIKLILRPSR